MIFASSLRYTLLILALSPTIWLMFLPAEDFHFQSSGLVSFAHPSIRWLLSFISPELNTHYLQITTVMCDVCSLVPVRSSSLFNFFSASRLPPLSSTATEGVGLNPVSWPALRLLACLLAVWLRRGELNLAISPRFAYGDGDGRSLLAASARAVPNRFGEQPSTLAALVVAVTASPLNEG